MTAVLQRHSHSKSTSSLSSTAILSQNNNPFEGLTIINEADFYDLQDHCFSEVPYFLNQIPGFLPPDDLYVKGSTKFQDIAALAIAKLFDPSLKKCNVHFKMGTNNLEGVMCNGGIVLSGRQMHVATQLPPWLTSTILLPDIAVYPYEGQIIEGDEAVKAIKKVQRTTIPIFIAEYYSLSILITARQLAIKLVSLLHLHRIYGCNQTEVSGLVLPAMENNYLDKVATGMAQLCLNPDEYISKSSSMTSTDADELVKAALPIEDQELEANSLKPKHKNNQNTAILITVKWDCTTFTFVISYKPLKKEEVVTVAKDLLCHAQQNFCCTHVTSTKDLSRSFFPLTKNELDELKVNLLSDSVLSEFIEEEWQSESIIELEQLHSRISFVFRLWGCGRRKCYVFKAFIRSISVGEYVLIERRLSRKKLSHCLLSKFSIPFGNTTFYCFEGLQQITRQKAKECLFSLVQGVHAAIEELHKHGMAHLDIRLPNLCFRKGDEAKCTVVLIDLERAKHNIYTPWNGDYKSCMYKKGFNLKQIDYLQLYWMAVWILSDPAALDYHMMDLETEFKDLEDEKCKGLCKTISQFIKNLPTEFKIKDWETFIEYVHVFNDKTLFSCVYDNN